MADQVASQIVNLLEWASGPVQLTRQQRKGRQRQRRKRVAVASAERKRKNIPVSPLGPMKVSSKRPQREDEEGLLELTAKAFLKEGIKKCLL